MNYSNNEYHKLRHGNVSLNAENYISNRRLKKIDKIVGLSKFNKILESGVGYGWNFKFHNKQVDGFDLINVLTNNNINFIDKSNLLPNTYDLIICHHVLEHVPDPLEFIKFNLNLLKPNGEILIFVPIEVKSSWNPSKNDLDNHFYTWTPRQLTNLINKNIHNVKVIKSNYLKFGFDRHAGELSNIFGKSISNFIQFIFLLFLPRYETYCLVKKVNS
jgi:SAM-dependent methyltransferase